MAFLSPAFFLCLIPALLAYYGLPARFRVPLLLACSYGFVLSHSVAAAAVLLVLSLGSYLAARRIDGASSEADKVRPLALGVGLCLVALGTFKYLPPLVAALVGQAPSALWAIGLPIGLSYYVFKLVSYLVDVYWGVLPAEKDPVRLLLHAAWFPQIPSGPIQRAVDFLPQLDAPVRFSPALFGSGLRLILFGVFEKLVVADRLAPAVDAVFDRPAPAPGAALLATFCYALQLYADFSAASDIAVGLARLFGFRSPANFDAPLSAGNVPEFWRRWHITLTSWVSDYVFLPLRMRLRHLGNAGLVLAILVNMMAVALWHGASWTFVLFGLLNGLYLSVSAFTLKPRNRFWKRYPRLAPLRATVGAVIVFHLMSLAFVFVRAQTAPQALSVIRLAAAGELSLVLHPVAFLAGINEFLRLSSVGRVAFGIALLGLCGMAAGNHLRRRPAALARFDALPVVVRDAVYLAAIFATLLLGQLTQRGFIYARY